MTDDPRSSVPPTNDLLADRRVQAALGRLARPVVVEVVRAVQEAVRRGVIPPGAAADEVVRRLPVSGTTMRPVLNATGVVVHTNLGRAPLAAGALDAVRMTAGYTDVELDVSTGRRARRGAGALAALQAALPDAGGVLVVNNGAAALLLALTVLAAGREVIWSRGELVEIGDGFRLPELMITTGARIREVGTTNRTTVDDYRAALGADTGCVLKVHPSNFVVAGFTSAATVSDLSALDAPLVVDVGSGLLRPDPLLPDEPDITTALRHGADLVTASGDKLLGGPQSGILAGDGALIQRLRSHPLARAVRVDKLTLAALEATLLGSSTPVSRALHADPAALRARCEAVAARVGGTVVPSDGAVGGGGGPGVTLPGWAVAVPAACAERLRRNDPCVMGRIDHDRCLLDLRCVPPEDDEVLVGAVLRCL